MSLTSMSVKSLPRASNGLESDTEGEAEVSAPFKSLFKQID